MYKITIIALMLAGCGPQNPYETKMMVDGCGSMEEVHSFKYRSYYNGAAKVVVICNDGNRFFFDR